MVSSSVPFANEIKVYTVNGANAGSSSSLPDWLVRKRASTRGKRARREHFEGTIELIQGFEFPEASNRVRTTPDGHSIIATGTYKPQMRVWDLDNLALKFERHTDAENVDFIILSDDWTKTVHLQNDRTVELHTQGGFHYKTRIPRFGRSLAYHFPSCDLYLSASGNEIYRLNLERGQFLNPLVLQDDSGDAQDPTGSRTILGVNVIDINPVHQLLAFGLEGNGTVQFWDPRSRSSVGTLRLPKSRLMSAGAGFASSLAGSGGGSLSVTALASRADGLSYAVGTSTGHTLLYDIRAARPFALKDQGYGLPVNNVSWIGGGSRMAGDGMVLSADKKVIKIWDRDSPQTNFASITPAMDVNDVHHVAGSGVILQANEGIQMATYFIPQLGPAPRWAGFLENITEEMEDQTVRTVYEDFKFVERSELQTLGLDHLVGTPTLKPYMHGYFLSLKLYDAARLIANPFAYAEHREKMVREKMDKMAETRIRARKDVGVKVNKALAEKVLRDEERARKREERKKARKVPEPGEGNHDEGDDPMEEETEAQSQSILKDPRFAQLFENPDFMVDENSREYALLNPSSVARKRNNATRDKTAVEDEEDESDKESSDGLQDGSDSDSKASDDSSDAGELNRFDPRARPGQKNARAQEAYNRTRERNRVANVKLVPLQAHSDGRAPSNDMNVAFGQRRAGMLRSRTSSAKKEHSFGRDRAQEVTWVPSSGNLADDDRLIGGDRPERKQKLGKRTPGKRKGVEEFGAGLERGMEPIENDRKGRTHRRTGVRSGSKNTFRRI